VLPNREVELNIIKEQATKFNVRLLRGPETSMESVIEGMEAHSWVHFACHGVQDTIEPIKSAFALHNKCLELSTIITKSFPHADFAFLSACQTATGAEKLSEEAVHLAAGLMLAGYGSVIVTIWSIKDKDAPIIAGHVYTKLFSDTVPDSSRSAVSLHHAVKLLRQQVGDLEFLSWVPFIHIGV
jgi:CHAT domain-containing protein